MASPEPSVPLDLLLQTLQREVEEKSLRRVASALGRSPNAIRNLLSGARPNAATVRKLTVWFRKLSAPPELSPNAAQAALDLLTSSLPEEDQIAFALNVLDSLSQHHKRRGLPQPQWIASLERAIQDRGLQ